MLTLWENIQYANAISLNAASEKTSNAINAGSLSKISEKISGFHVHVTMRCSELYGDIERLAEMTSPPTVR